MFFFCGNMELQQFHTVSNAEKHVAEIGAWEATVSGLDTIENYPSFKV